MLTIWCDCLINKPCRVNVMDCSSFSSSSVRVSVLGCVAEMVRDIVIDLKDTDTCSLAGSATRTGPNSFHRNASATVSQTRREKLQWRTRLWAADVAWCSAGRVQGSGGYPVAWWRGWRSRLASSSTRTGNQADTLRSLHNLSLCLSVHQML
jgi:hypothetical protein